jgi:hypothetical protein
LEAAFFGGDGVESACEGAGAVEGGFEEGRDASGGVRLGVVAAGEGALEDATHHPGTCDLLTEVVMEVLADAALFEFADVEDFPFELAACFDEALKFVIGVAEGGGPFLDSGFELGVEAVEHAFGAETAGDVTGDFGEANEVA